jgi:hypothetical protein
MNLLRKRTPTTRQRRILEPTERAASSVTYYSRRSDEELNTGRKLQRKVKERIIDARRIFWLQRAGLVIALVAVIVVAVNVLSLSSNDKIMLESSDTSGLFLHNQASYQTAAHKILAASVWDHNKVTIDTSQLARDLTSEFPELTNVSVALPMFAHQPVVYIQIAQPALILNDSHGSYVLDINGRVLTNNTSAASFASLDLPAVTDRSGLTLRRNIQALPSGNVVFIQTVVAQLAARGFKVASMSLPQSTSELDAQVASQPYIIKFNLESGDARQQVGTYLATQASLQRQNITPAHYIDVRVDGRAYYQ